ncbi:MAG: hypothetical protein JWM34_4732 [Ilumatobacteraceae bacterium]|nr:hypothetical protein [Ilumatobacteraceae bacterium]
MFGRMKVAGVATVQMCEEIHTNVAIGSGAGHNMYCYDMVIDVTPDSGTPFRCESKQWLHISPRVGDQVHVRCNPAKGKAEVIVKGDPRYDTRITRDTARQRRKAELQADRDRLLGGNANRQLP